MSYKLVNPREIEIAQQSVNCAFWNARKTFSEKSIKQFSEVIRADGLLQDLTVRELAGRYQLVAGERRLRVILMLLESNSMCFDLDSGSLAPARAVYGTIQCKVLHNCSDKLAVQRSVSENLEREDVSQVDLMQYCAELEEYRNERGEKGYTRAEICKVLRRSPTWVSQTLSLFDLPPRAIEALANGTIERSVALYLLKLKPETVDLVVDRAELMARQASEEELLENERQINDTEAKLEQLDMQVAAKRGLGLVGADGSVTRSRDMLNKCLQEARTRQDGLRARRPRISKQSLQDAANLVPGSLKGKESVMTHKQVRQFRDRLVKEMSEGTITHPKIGLPFQESDLHIVVGVMDMMLGTGARSPLEVLTHHYQAQNVPGWDSLRFKS